MQWEPIGYLSEPAESTVYYLSAGSLLMNLGLKSGYKMLQQLKKKKCKTENVGAGLEKNSVT